MRETVSVVISAYNEGESVNELHKELGKVMKDLPLKDYELIFVDDGSKDDTYAKCQKLQEKDKHVKIVHLRRNFGHEVAMTAGMDYAKGDAVVFMDADLQHPPVYIKEMVKYWQEGTDIVLTKRVENQATSKFYDMCAALFYKVLNFLSDTKIPAKNGYKDLPNP